MVTFVTFHFRHSPDVCSIMKNKSSKDTCINGKSHEENLNDFYQKVKKFEDHYSDIRIDIIWECQWSHKKKMTLKSASTSGAILLH